MFIPLRGFHSSLQNLPVVMVTPILWDTSALEGGPAVPDVLSGAQHSTSLGWQPEKSFLNPKIWWQMVKGSIREWGQTLDLIPQAQEAQSLNTDAEHDFQWSKILLCVVFTKQEKQKTSPKGFWTRPGVTSVQATDTM